jgi:hypothetical protein
MNKPTLGQAPTRKRRVLLQVTMEMPQKPPNSIIIRKIFFYISQLYTLNNEIVQRVCESS